MLVLLAWLAILLGSEAKQSSGWANLLSILSVSCTGFAVLTELSVVNATQLLKENQITVIHLSERFCYSLYSSEGSSEGLIVQALRLSYMYKAHNNETLLSASGSTDFHFHLLMAVTATLQIFPKHPYCVSHYY